MNAPKQFIRPSANSTETPENLQPPSQTLDDSVPKKSLMDRHGIHGLLAGVGVSIVAISQGVKEEKALLGGVIVGLGLYMYMKKFGHGLPK